MTRHQRMSRLSLENLKVADRAELIAAIGGGYGVKLWRGDSACIINDGSAPIRYNDAAHARRNLRRVRPDLQITSI